MQIRKTGQRDAGQEAARRARDEGFMRRAIELAKAGEGWVHPNPLVGAVIVKDGKIIGEGYHRRYGDLHAERNALADAHRRAGAAAADLLEGASMYVSLEPCCHQGKTPPCTEAILQHRIGRVVIGSRDPNPLVAGQGAKILRQAGVLVEEDFLREECDALNPVFFHYITSKQPYVILKYAMTADGKIATRTGASKWITGEEARLEVQRMRHACMAICAGIGTVLADDPLLNCRIEGGRQPVRVICDSRLRIPLDSRICRTAGAYETILVCAVPELPEGELTEEAAEGLWQTRAGKGPVTGDAGADAADLLQRIRRLRTCGVSILNLPGQGDGERPAQVDLKELMTVLGARGIDSLLLEGGGALNESSLQAGIVSEVRAFLAPKIFGGQAKSPVEGTGVALPDAAIPLQLAKIRQIGEDLLVCYRTGAYGGAQVPPSASPGEHAPDEHGPDEKEDTESADAPPSPDGSREGK